MIEFVLNEDHYSIVSTLQSPLPLAAPVAFVDGYAENYDENDNERLLLHVLS